VHVTAGNAGRTVEIDPARANWSMRGIRGPMNRRVNPTTLITATRCMDLISATPPSVGQQDSTRHRPANSPADYAHQGFRPRLDRIIPYVRNLRGF
jgi:hypothetical protein